MYKKIASTLLITIVALFLVVILQVCRDSGRDPFFVRNVEIEGDLLDDFADEDDANCIGGTNGDEAADNCSMTHSYESSTFGNAANSAKLNYSVVTDEWGAKFVFDFGGAKDLSSNQYLILFVKGGDLASDTPEKIKIEMADLDHEGWAHTVPLIPDDTLEGTAISTGWTKYTMPLTAFDGLADFEPKNLRQLGIIFEDGPVGTNTTGMVYIDDIYFSDTTSD